jgi:hypothetical protein
LRHFATFCVALAIIGTAISIDSFAQGDKRQINISIGKFPSDMEMMAWTAYGISLGDWVNRNRIADSASEGPFVPSFDAELHARQKQLVIWRELNEKERYSLRYMDEMQQVESAGFLREYIWHFHRRPGWATPPAGLQMEAFSQWQANHLRGHTPQTGARIVFGPPVKR